MKFLCVTCDEPMTLNNTQGPDNGSMSLIFGCPSCGHEVAMLTNPMETQMVRALDIKIGGRTAPAQPMEMVRTSLAAQRDGLSATTVAAPAQEPATTSTPSGSKCPFTGAVNEAFAQQESAAGPVWTEEAQARIENIPSFVRSMVKKSVEDYAREQGYPEIDATVMDEVKGRLGM